MLWEALGSFGEALGGFGEALGGFGRLWEALGSLWEALGRLWEGFGRLWGCPPPNKKTTTYKNVGSTQTPDKPALLAQC